MFFNRFFEHARVVYNGTLSIRFTDFSQNINWIVD
ncbi:MAG: helix-turn-helix domain-containing protein [Granulicatella adiacens]